MREIDTYVKLVARNDSILEQLINTKDDDLIIELTNEYYSIQNKIRLMKEKMI